MYKNRQVSRINYVLSTKSVTLKEKKKISYEDGKMGNNLNGTQLGLTLFPGFTVCEEVLTRFQKGGPRY